MNYIHHITGFYDKILDDDRLNPTHISLYHALFQFWNLNHFRNPISISRSEMMRISKISALGTYHKCIKQLEQFGYIQYMPSFNPYKGSLVNLFSFENSEVQNLNTNHIKKQTASKQALEQVRIKIDTGSEQALTPSINNINILNHKQNIDCGSDKNFDNEDLLLKRKKMLMKIPPHISEVELFFLEKNSTKMEAEKFFNHYESNGWLIGGKSKMKNWEAAARNWLINSKKFNSSILSAEKQPNLPKPNHLNASTNKSYRDEL